MHVQSPLDRSHDPAGDSSRPAAQKISLLGLPRHALAEALAPFIDRRFRTDQIYSAVYERGIDDFAALTNLGKPLAEQLRDRFSLAYPEIAHRHESDDGTAKYLFRLDDGATIEAVDIPDGERRTLCLSSQAGCALACRFCVTGYWGGGRNLTAGEIVGQVLAIRRHPRPDTHGLNLVFMGMGEPLLNLDALRNALEILLEQISWRRITVSTAGVIPGIETLASWKRRPQIAISLHAPDEERRSSLMPINQRYPLAELMPALRRFPLASKERITFEYLMLDSYNDSPADADLLAGLLAGARSKVNLIPLNPDPVLPEGLRPSPPARVAAFRDRLRQRGVLTTVRKQRGDDVSAACGQLRAPGREPRGFRRSNLSF
ncbi:MAG: 23S rRNA (adenine(2503)-C(2))-methyltransferase RlmN [Holophagales bacterium]|nr:23S rRNA (adenine(2503)-C(2))-methyltransferase RlmN [Holophagales bacterium]